MLRPDTQIFKNDFRHYIQEYLNKANAEDIFRTCLTCVYFEANENCIKANKRPPAFVIVRGCDMYFDTQDVPF